MSILVVMLTLVLLAAVIVVVSRPLLVERKTVESERPRLAELYAQREAKYREIRDTELDYRTGKLSSEDFGAVNGTLRAEALEILDSIEALEHESRSERSEQDEGDESRTESSERDEQDDSEQWDEQDHSEQEQTAHPPK